MIPGSSEQHRPLEQSIKEEARRLGFVLAGVTTPEPPTHAPVFERWLAESRNGTMHYLAAERSRACRADPRELLPGCQSILMLAVPYSKPDNHPPASAQRDQPRGRVAAYAWGKDYHKVLPRRMRALVRFIEARVGHSVPHRCFTDSAPVLERDLAQRAGLGWIGKNTCLINPRMGSYVLLSEILLELELEPDAPILTDHCGTCTRCVEACPTHCILPDRTLDARRCISYLTIELRGSMPADLRTSTGDWIFGCDVCQTVCPWNRFSPEEGDPEFSRHDSSFSRSLTQGLELSKDEFAAQHEVTPMRRTTYDGYLRNLAVATGNTAGTEALPVLRRAARHERPLVREHATWAIEQIMTRTETDG